MINKWRILPQDDQLIVSFDQRMPDGRRKGYKIDDEDRMYQATKEWEAMPLKNIASLNNLAKRCFLNAFVLIVILPIHVVKRKRDFISLQGYLIVITG